MALASVACAANTLRARIAYVLLALAAVLCVPCVPTLFCVIVFFLRANYFQYQIVNSKVIFTQTFYNNSNF